MQTNTLTKTNTTYLVKFLILLAVATGAPLFGFHSQWVTGPIVNMALILAVFIIGIRGALLIGILPSTIALSTGLLPAVLAPTIPFIIISNCVLILCMDLFCHPVLDTGSRIHGFRIEVRNDNKYWFVLFIGAGMKYLFLFFTSGIIINLLLNSAVAPKVAQMMSWPQFFTAIIGGILAWGILKLVTQTFRPDKRQGYLPASGGKPCVTKSCNSGL